MAVLKERYHIRVRINTHHNFIQQASGIMSFVAGRTHNGLAFRTELEQNQLEQSVFFQNSAIGKKDHLASERSSQWLGYRGWFTLQARNLALKILFFGGWERDLSHQLICTALLPLNLPTKNQNLNCVAYIKSDLIPVYTSPRCDSIDLLTISHVFTVLTGVQLVHGFLTRIGFKFRDVESHQALSIEVYTAHLRPHSESIVKNKCTLKKALYTVHSRLPTIILYFTHIWKISTFKNGATLTLPWFFLTGCLGTIREMLTGFWLAAWVLVS